MESRVTPIAVIGMGCRLPGGIDSPDELWQALLRGDDLVTEIPADRWDVEEHYDPERGVLGRSVSRWGGFIDDVGGFRRRVLRLSGSARRPRSTRSTGCCWRRPGKRSSMRASCPGRWPARRTGVFVGLCHDDYTVITSDAGALEDAYGYTGTPFSMASGRIAYALGLQGPAITVDTSCSSGLLAVHMAAGAWIVARAILPWPEVHGDAGAAGITASASAQGMLSPTGRCHTFDVAADGFVRSEGCAVVLLKRLPDALRDGDRILAVVRGTAANQDGRSETITTPSRTRRPRSTGRHWRRRAWTPTTVGMVEAHGTGTPVGDPLEFTEVWRGYTAPAVNRVALGSAKSNLGHTEAAAGAVGLIKADPRAAARCGAADGALHPVCPMSCSRSKPDLFVPQEVTPWPDRWRPAPRRAAVSSFGMSGTNVHAVLEQAPETHRAGRRGSRIRHERARCCFRCRRPLPTSCAGPRGGWPTGWTTTKRIPCRCRTWPTPWRVGAGTGPCAPRCSPTSLEELTAGSARDRRR